MQLALTSIRRVSARDSTSTALSVLVHVLVLIAVLWTWQAKPQRPIAEPPDTMTVMLIGANSINSSAVMPAIATAARASQAAAKPAVAKPHKAKPAPIVTSSTQAISQPTPSVAPAPAIPSTAATSAQTAATASNASAAALASTAAAPRDADISTPPPIEYLRRISRIISMSQKYPWSARQDGQQGDVIVRMHLARTGNVLATRMIHSSGYAALDAEAQDVILRIAKFPPFPSDYIPSIAEFDIDQPISFRHYLN